MQIVSPAGLQVAVCNLQSYFLVVNRPACLEACCPPGPGFNLPLGVVPQPGGSLGAPGGPQGTLENIREFVSLTSRSLPWAS